MLGEGADSDSEGFLNSSCTSSSSGESGSLMAGGDAAMAAGALTAAAQRDQGSAAERASLETLPDGVLERIYSFCPHSVVAHLPVCRRFCQHLVYAESVWLRPKVGAKQPFVVPYAGGRSHPAVEPNRGAPNWSLPTAEAPGANRPPLCQPHWSAPPAHTYTETYHHKDYPGDSSVSTGVLCTAPSWHRPAPDPAPSLTQRGSSGQPPPPSLACHASDPCVSTLPPRSPLSCPLPPPRSIPWRRRAIRPTCARAIERLRRRNAAGAECPGALQGACAPAS